MLLAPRDIPDLHFAVTEREGEGDSPEKTDVIELMNVNTEDCCPRNSDFREHSRNSLEGVAGEAQVQLRDQRSARKGVGFRIGKTISANTENILKNHRIMENPQIRTVQQPG